MLWTSADPGCGKSVLAKYLVDKVLPAPGKTICYYFFKDDFPDQRTAVSAISCVLRQLFIANDTLMSDEILDQFEKDSDNLLKSFQSLWELFISVVSQPMAGDIICVLDALDECEQPGRSAIAEALSDLYQDGPFKHPLKFLVTSRPYLEIKRGFQLLKARFPVIHLGGENEEEVDKISREVDHYIHQKLEDLSVILGLLAEERDTLYQTLTANPNRTYLWVWLVFDFLRNSVGITRENLEEQSRSIPDTVEAAYEKILSRSRNKEKARKMLHIVVAAKRPMRLDEMALALALGDRRSCAEISLEPMVRFCDTIRDLCGLFVSIVDSRIYLLHQTAREFLVRAETTPVQLPASDACWKHLLEPAKSNRILAEICMRYLLLDDFTSKAPELVSDLAESKTNNFALLDYAAEYWAPHLSSSGRHQDTSSLRLAARVCDASNKLIWIRRNWFSTFQAFDRFSGLAFACGHVGTILGQLVAEDFSLVDLTQSNALSLAAEQGCEIMVDVLISRGVDLNTMDESGLTPLGYATKVGHFNIALSLIRAGANINYQSGNSSLPLVEATLEGHDELVRLLLESGADPRLCHGQNNITALIMAARQNNAAIIQLLLDHGADIEAMDTYGNSALLEACHKSSFESILYLLDAGARTNVRNGAGSEAMHLVVPSLSRYSITIDRGRHVLDALWQMGTNIDPTDEEGRTPLHLAASHSVAWVVEWLLNHGALVNAQDRSLWTPLHASIYHGNGNSTVKVLVLAGADLEAQDIRGITPLNLAAGTYTDQVKLLIAEGASVDTKDHAGNTPLHRACRDFFGEYRSLIRAGADFDSRNEDGQSPLHMAAMKNTSTALAFLIRSGANTSVKDRLGNTPLHVACSSADMDIKPLLDAGAPLEDTNDKGETPLHVAVSNANASKAANLLIQRGADLGARDNRQYTPEMVAIFEGHEAVRDLIRKARASRNHAILLETQGQPADTPTLGQRHARRPRPAAIWDISSPQRR
jgi:ankyrin repeat protein